MAMRNLRAFAYTAVLGIAACGGDDVASNGLVAVDDQVTIDEDAPILVDVLANDSDAEGRPLELRRASAEGYEVTVEDGRVRIPTQPDWSGSIDVTYIVVAGTDSARAHAIITVAPVNDAPTARAGIAATGRNHPRAILLQGDDIEGDALTFAIDAGPMHGTLSGTPPAITYTPAEGYIGEDAITFHARDAALSSAAATIAINVLNGTVPVASAQAVTTLEETPREITLRGTDLDNDPLTFAITTQPQHGTLTGTPPTVTYTPAVDYVGPDGFAFTANDGVLTSDPATVAITVTNVNDPPVAQVQMIAATEDVPFPITLVGTDTESTVLTYAIVDAPTHGTVTGTGAARTYTPAPNYHGPDSFTFTASDGMATSAPATVEIVVASIEDAPVARAEALGTPEDMPRTFTLGGSDGDGDPLTFMITGITHGDVDSFGGPSVTFTPEFNYSGQATITFTANDGDETSAPATVTFTVTPVDDVPFIPAGAITVAEDELAAIPLPATDVDGEALTYTITTPPAHGTISGNGAARQYRAVNYNGEDSFTVTASDGHTTSQPRTFPVTVTPVEDTPVARDDFSIATDGQWVEIDVMANDDDADPGDFIFIESVGTPSQGEAQTDGDVVTYRPASGNTTQATFTYTVVDATGRHATATVNVGIGELPRGMPLAAVGKAVNYSTAPLPNGQLDLSRDGRYVAFASDASLVAADTNQVVDIYVWDRFTNTRELVSKPLGAGAADAMSYQPSISADGRYVAFSSVATNLVAGDTNATTDVFVRDRVTGTTVRASVSSSGAQATGYSNAPDISADGTVVSFSSSAFDLVPVDSNGVYDIFVRDLTAGTTTRVSVRTGGGEADRTSVPAVLSGDGRFVAFVSGATNLVTGDVNNKDDVFVHDRQTGITERASVSSVGVESNGVSSLPVISYDGRFVGFRTSATNLGSGQGVYVRDRLSPTTLLAASSAVSLSMSADGRYVTGHTYEGACWIRDRFAASTHDLSLPGGNDLLYPVMSANGRYVVLLSENALLPNVASGNNAYVYPNPL
jgi:hypothetical protein